ncbi:MAG: hypothetical protein K5655_01195 [Lachnospiraceae bacterium]|nr:hypothetical protein [Lachnospiraceae bacterium]
MNEQGYEISINLGDMFAYILHRWKLVLIISIVFMISIGGYQSYVQYDSIQNKYADATYNEMTREMTQEQITNVDLFYSRYQGFQERIKENKLYSENSLLMRINADNVSVLTKEYFVRTNYQGVMSSFSTIALDLDDYKKMAAVFGNDIDPRYVGEVVSLSGSIDKSGYDIDTTGGGMVLEMTSGTINDSYSGVLILTVSANSREDCEKIALIAEDAIEKHVKELKSVDINVVLSELSAAYTERVDSGIAEFQRSKNEEGSKLVTDYLAFEENARLSMNQQQNDVFSYLIEKDQEFKEQFSWKRYFVIGLLVGCLAAVIFLAALYICSPAIKSLDDIERFTKEKGIGVIIQKKKSGFFLNEFFSNWAKRIEFHGIKKTADNEAIAFICDRIGNICEDKKADKVFLVSDTECEYTKSVLEKAVGLLKELGIEALTGDPANSLEALKGLRQSQVAVLAVTMKDSLPKVVRDEYIVCEENKIPVVANFVVCPQK